MPGINIRAKGAGAEREIADDLNYIIHTLYKELGIEGQPWAIVQRNQNQSAVGGKDLTGTFGLAIEVKRQEALSINTWWAQCVKSAEDLGEVPVLLFRQSKQKWRCITMVRVPLPDNAYVTARAELDYESFKSWFRSWVQRKVKDLPASEVEAAAYPTVFD